MCAAFEFKGKASKPGKPVTAAGPRGPLRLVWAGFARQEILSWWEGKGAILIDVPATRFAERSGVTGKLLWDVVPSGLVIRGLVDHQTNTPLIKILTRQASEVEFEKFQHPRMPVLEKALFEPVSDDCFRVYDGVDLFDL